MLTDLNSAPTARSAATVCAEKPHCGKSGVPFMNSTTGLEESSDLILSTTSIAHYLLSFRRSASSPTRFHCSAALMYSQRPISSPVRRQPTQNPPVSREQTLMHGDGGRSSGFSESWLKVR